MFLQPSTLLLNKLLDGKFELIHIMENDSMHSLLSRALNIVWAVIYEDALLGTHTKLRKKQLVDFSFGLQVVTGVRDKAILQGREYPRETGDNLMYFR